MGVPGGITRRPVVAALSLTVAAGLAVGGVAERQLQRGQLLR